MGKKQWINDGKPMSLKLSVVYPDIPQGSEVQKTGGKYDAGHTGILLWRVKFLGQADSTIFTTIAAPEKPVVGESIELYISKEESNGKTFQKGFTAEQYAKETASGGGGGGGYRGSDSKHAGWGTMYVIHLQVYLKEGKPFDEARKLAKDATNEVFKGIEV